MRRTDRRPCRVVGCTGEMLAGRLMCGTCWKRVPQDLQRAVRSAVNGSRPEVWREALAVVAAKLAEDQADSDLADDQVYAALGHVAKMRRFHVETEGAKS